MFEECRLEGEVTLSSGRKSDVFYDFDLLHPRETANYAERLVREIPEHLWNEIDFIASPALGGIVPGFLVAFAKQKPFVIIDKEGKSRGPQFDTGRYLIVDDVITSFKAANLVRDSLSRSAPGLEAVGVAAYIFRGSRDDLGKQKYPAFYLARKEQEVE
jgi:orotate phosphoribosyltransferase